MGKEEVQALAFQLIGYAGDAYSCFKQAVAKAREGSFEEADRLLEQGKESLVEAHHTQTEMLTAETQGQDIAYSILMVHAQDHLMNAIMYEDIAKEFVALYKERGK